MDVIDTERIERLCRGQDEDRIRDGEAWRKSVEEEGSYEVREWNNESKKIIIKNESSADIGPCIPWNEVLVYAPENQKPSFKITKYYWHMTLTWEGYDRLSYEPRWGSTEVTVWRNRMSINTWRARKKRKRLKREAMRLIEKQVSMYYGVSTEMRFCRGKKAYVFYIKDIIRDGNRP